VSGYRVRTIGQLGRGSTGFTTSFRKRPDNTKLRLMNSGSSSGGWN
jgi:hypothetical protein